MKTATVWLPTYNRINSVKMALTSLLCQDTNDFDVMLYADNTEDFRKELIKETALIREALFMKGVEVEIPASTSNIGICAVKNYLLSITKTKWFLYLEDDSVLSGNFISGLINYVKIYDNGDIAGVGGVQQMFGAIVGEPGFTETIAARVHTFLHKGMLWNDFDVRPDSVLFLNKAQMHFYYDTMYETDFGVINLKTQAYEAKCLIHTYMLSTEKTKNIGGWDMDYNFPYYSFEEIDLTHKLYHLCGKLMVLPYLEMYHMRSHEDRKPTNLVQAYRLHEKIFIDKWISK